MIPVLLLALMDGPADAPVVHGVVGLVTRHEVEVHRGPGYAPAWLGTDAARVVDFGGRPLAARDLIAGDVVTAARAGDRATRIVRVGHR